MEIIWTKLAKITYVEILENLNLRWTKKEMKSFKDLTNDLLENVKKNEIIHPYVNNNLEIRKAVIQKMFLYSTK